MEADGPLGIVTEADLAVLVAEEGDLKETTAADLMTTDPVTVDGYEDVEEAARVMKKKGIRNLPVVHDGAFVGILTSTDVTYHLSEIMSGVSGGRMDKDEVRELLEEAR